MLVGILSVRSSSAHDFTFPFRAFAKQIKQLGLTVKIRFEPDASLADCDVLCIVDKRFRKSLLNRNPPEKIDLLRRYAPRVRGIVWFDTRDSTGQTSFEVLPYVGVYAKRQLFRDRLIYTQQSYVRKTRIFARYYQESRGVEDDPQPRRRDTGYPQRQVAQPEELNKLAVSWNWGLGDNGPAPGTWEHYLRLVWPRAKYRFETTPVASDRDIHVSYRVSMQRLPTVDFQREETRRQLADLATNGGYRTAYQGKIPNRGYWSEIRRTLIMPSPFGGGEICYRDFECFLAGAVLVKPDMSHLTTWPDYYEPGVAYVPHAWDFSDFQSKIIELIESPAKRQTIAQAGQERYLDSLSPAGGEAFARHFASLMEKAIDKSRM